MRVVIIHALPESIEPTKLAFKEIYPEASSIACKTFEEMFECVRQNNADVAVVPIENSRAGRVADTQLLIPDSKLKIVGEYFLEVNHCLIGTKDSSPQFASNADLLLKSCCCMGIAPEKTDRILI